jgi:hypothetical protein
MVNYLLGIRTTEPLFLKDVSNKLVGFLENITKHQFEALHALRYPSLYSFKYSDEHNTVETTYYFALFGTVALCNYSQDTNVQFRHLDDVGKLLLWKTTMTFNEELHSSNYQGFSSFQSGDFFEVCDRQLSPPGDVLAPFEIDMGDLRITFHTLNGKRKLNYFVKVSLYDVNNTQFKAGDEVYVFYIN